MEISFCAIASVIALAKQAECCTVVNPNKIKQCIN